MTPSDDDGEDLALMDTEFLDDEPSSGELAELAPLVDQLEPRPPPQLAPGTLLADSFEIEEAIGAGGMGIVYRARDLQLERPVALKLHRPMKQGTERLLREASSMAQLTHPNVATVHEVGTHQGMLFIAMEFIDGVTARRWVTTTERTVAEIVMLYHAAGQGLAAAHRAGFVHRDFKPENVLVGLDDVPRVVDFGLARPLSEAHVTPSWSSHTFPSGVGTLTLTNVVVGTPAYMAPEQFEGTKVDARADQFAFAVSLHEALFGRRPFSEESMVQHLAAISTGRFELPARPRIPARVQRVIRRALAPSPGDRFESMDALLGALGPDPKAASRRTWLIATGASLGASGLVAGLLTLDLDDTAERCAGQSAHAPMAWSTRRDDVEAAFTGLERDWAIQTFATVERHLDEHEQHRRHALAMACEARARAAMPSEQLDRRDECLRRVGVRVDALIERLVEANRPVASKAYEAVLELPSPQQCADPLHLTRTIGTAPASPESIQAYALHARAVAHHQAGLNNEALKLVREARDEVGALDDPSLEAPTLFIEGLALHSAGRNNEASASFEQAFFAARKVDDPATASEAATSLVRMFSEEPERWSEVDLWGKLAIAEAQRAQAEGPLEAQAQEALGWYDELTGRYDEALERYRAALAMLEGDGPPLDRVRVLLGLGTTTDRRGDHARALEHYRAAQQLIERTVGADHPRMMSVLNNISLTYTSLGEPDRAVTTMERAIAITRTNIGRTHPLFAENLHNMGVCYAEAGRFDDAMAQYEEAMQIIDASDEPNRSLQAHLYSNLSVVHDELGDHEAAIDLARKAVQSLEALKGPEHPDLAPFLSNLASSVKHRDPEAALQPAERAVAIMRAHAPSGTEMATALVISGELYVMLKRFDDAIDVLETALRIYEQQGHQGPFLARAQGQLGLTLVEGADLERGIRLLEAGASAYEALGDEHIEDAQALRARRDEIRAGLEE